MGAQLYQNLGHLILMLLLLCGSAFFSGTETAVLNLTRRQVKHFEESEHRLSQLLSRLLKGQRRLVNCLLFGNMTVNVLFYATSSVFIVRVKEGAGLGYAGVTAVVTFVALVLFGEILPKSLAFANSRYASIAAALPSFVVVKIFGPLEFISRFLILEPVLRLFLGTKRQPRAITVGEFKSLIDSSRRQGLITADENRLLTEVIELGFLKVRHVMRPRVDMLACSAMEPSSSAREMMQRNGMTKLPVYSKTIDNITGMVYLREILLRPGVPLDRMVRDIHFVPEQKTVESLLEFFRKSGTDIAIVVDEYGGIAGVVRLEDIAEELFGQMEMASGIEPVQQTGPFEYRLAGYLTIHDWGEVFGIGVEETRLATIGGLVTAALGKMPKSGDVAVLYGLKFTVEKVRRHRIETLILSLEPGNSIDE